MVQRIGQPSSSVRPSSTPKAEAPIAPKVKGAEAKAPARADTADAKQLLGGAVLTPPLVDRRPPPSRVDQSLTSIALNDGATRISDRATFEKLSKRDDVPGAPGAREVKFLIVGVGTKSPQLYFVNTNTHQYHYDFASKGLGKQISLEEFNRLTYFTDKRTMMAGTIVAHDSFQADGQKKGLYAMEFWPTDPVKANNVALAYELITKNMPFADGQVRYHPSGNTQEGLFAQEKAALEKAGVKSIGTTELFKNVTFTPLNPGEGFGVLRVFDGSQPNARPPSVRDVVIFKTLPNDLSHVGGVITETPQTPLSHINLKCKQNDTPNAFLKDASTDPAIAPLIGKLVKYEVGPDGVKMREATQAEADAWLEKCRPPNVQHPPRDLSRKEVVDLDRLSNRDLKSFGAKAANIGELRNVLGPEMVPDGYGIPFSFYDEFMKANGFYEKATAMMNDPAFKADPAVREAKLAAFRREIRRAPVPPALEAKLDALQKKFPPDQAIRCRSSTNNEDLQGFNGAGLYDSYTHRPDEGRLSETVKQVWGSLWNYRAFEEREFNRIDHLSAAMGVAVHANFDDEVSNGVAVTKNIYDPNWEGFYVNVQVGESLVTNPDPNATPDELLISAIGENGEWETQYIRHSTLTEQGKTVLTDEQTEQLREAMQKIQEHFRRVYKRPASDTAFAMDIEFKIDSKGQLIVKQARPWVD